MILIILNFILFLSLSLQAQFKQETGMDYKPGMSPPSSAPAPPSTQADSSSCPHARVAQQGELLRKLKAEQAPKVPGLFNSFTNNFLICYLLAQISRSICPIILHVPVIRPFIDIELHDLSSNSHLLICYSCEFWHPKSLV